MRTCPLGSMLWGRRSASSPSDAQLCTRGFGDSLSGCCEGGCLFAYYGFRGSGRGSIDPIRFVIGGACWSPFPPATSGCQLVSMFFLAISSCQLVSLPCSLSSSPFRAVSWSPGLRSLSSPPFRVACGFSLPRPCPFLPRHGAPFSWGPHRPAEHCLSPRQRWSVRKTGGRHWARRRVAAPS